MQRSKKKKEKEKEKTRTYLAETERKNQQKYKKKKMKKQQQKDEAETGERWRFSLFSLFMLAKPASVKFIFRRFSSFQRNITSHFFFHQTLKILRILGKQGPDHPKLDLGPRSENHRNCQGVVLGVAGGGEVSPPRCPSETN